jgi:hypothetical protein
LDYNGISLVKRPKKQFLTARPLDRIPQLLQSCHHDSHMVTLRINRQAAHWHCTTGWLQSGQMRPVSVE